MAILVIIADLAMVEDIVETIVTIIVAIVVDNPAERRANC